MCRRFSISIADISQGRGSRKGTWDFNGWRELIGGLLFHQFRVSQTLSTPSRVRSVLLPRHGKPSRDGARAAGRARLDIAIYSK